MTCKEQVYAASSEATQMITAKVNDMGSSLHSIPLLTISLLTRGKPCWMN